ncbi:MAG TPA: hypothetical protein VF257_13415 [Solirubrobacteraceae bacterium]
MSEREDQHQPAPWDPAGTRPKHDPETLLPATPEPLLPPDADVVDSSAVDEDERDDLLPERRRAGGAAVPAAAKHSAYAPRFQFLTGALVAVGIAALVGIAVLVIAPSTRTPPPPWSPWQPRATGVAGAAEIADHVAREYRDKGKQLVKIDANDLSFKGVPLTVALRTAPEQGGNIQIHDEKGVLYQLCGLTSSCAIDHGKPSTERGLLLRREGLELALYSFRYLKDVKQVVVLIPPVKGKVQTIALYFRRDEVRAELARPLTSSLVPKVPTVENVTLSPDAPLVDRATDEQYLFTLNGSSFNNGGFLVLEPYTPAGDDRLQREIKQQQQAAATSGG